MPATESTWRDTGRMHRIFAVSGVLLTISTVWMFWKDHYRSWKTYQVKSVNVDLKMTKLREQQYHTGEAVIEHDLRSGELAGAKAQALEPQGLGGFLAEADNATATLKKWGAKYPYSSTTLDKAGIQRRATELAKLAETAAAAAKSATDAAKAVTDAAKDPKFDLQMLEDAARKADQAALAAEQKAGALRDEIVAEMRAFSAAVKIREDKALGIRKVRLGLIDAAKATVDIAIRDNLGPEEIARRQKVVDDLMGQEGDAEQGRETFAAHNEIYQTISGSRKNLDRNIKSLTAAEEAAKKKYDDSLAEVERLKKQAEDQEETYFQLSWQYPFLLGKKWTTLPILDAFNSRRKIENLWADGLMQDYSHAKVRRFDRCTTCHQSLVKTLPNQPTTPAYIREELVEMLVNPPPKDGPPKSRLDKDGNQLKLDLEDWLGIRLASEGLLVADDVTVALVLPNTPAAKAQIISGHRSAGPENGLDVRTAFARQVSPPGEGENLYPTLPGLLVGDVLVGINGQDFKTTGGDRGPRAIAARLMLLAEAGHPIRLSIRRGLPNPYISHPRLDLYLSDASPHKMQTFACTICHEGQGTATEFKWASHTPSSTLDMDRWSTEHGWFDNGHWIFPMFPKRFAQSACLKCHHEVVDLEPSDRFPEAPAPKVVHGYHLIRKYGCYGCHEVNGFDGPTRRVGPDLRSEPNYFAVAQQIQAELNSAARRLTSAGSTAADNSKAAERLAAWKEQLEKPATELTAHPEDNQTRNAIRTRIDEGVAAAGKDAGALDRSLSSLANMLKDVEAPGDQRRPGPSLRFINDKVDPIFLFDWINNPRHFRDTTRMPRFFGLWDHLKDAHGETEDKAPRLEPIEIRGMIAYLQTYAADQRFEPVPHAKEISNWTDEEKVARGKIQFQTRGCLACHNHREFPEVASYRPHDEIVQGPDLSGVGSKFDPARNPKGPEWLYSWIKNPTKYHARTVMPNLFLERDMIAGPDPLDPNKDAKYFDPADDIVTYLLASSRSDWQPIPAAATVTQPLDAAGQQALKDLMLEHLNDAFYKDAAEEYYVVGIPPHLEGELKGAEKDLIVQPGQKLTDPQRLKYIGRKTIAKYGCFGCHDIPGFEDAKPIGTGLADWGRKDPAKLAFEHIAHYVEGHGAGHGKAPAQAGAKGEKAAPAKAGDPHAPAAQATAGETPAATGHTPGEELTVKFFEHALEAQNRIGFIYQKLQEPRSYDFEKIENKRYNERLRMPQFPFTVEEREAVITFVLGLVADPPQPKYVYSPQPRSAALIAGREVLEKYNCGGCHILGSEKWQISFAAGQIKPPAEPADFPFLKSRITNKELEASAKQDRRGEMHSVLLGILPMESKDGYPQVRLAADGDFLIDDQPYSANELTFGLHLLRPTAVGGTVAATGKSPIYVPTSNLDSRSPAWGGVLTKYLLPVVTAIERRTNSNASGIEAYGWLPPPLVGEGQKVQSAWLHDFLLEPYAIRPAVFLRMPKFNMSSREATILANYFAAADDAEFPYAYASTRDRQRLATLEADYVQRPAPPPLPATPAPAATGAAEATPAQPTTAQPTPAVSASAPAGMQRLDDAMKIVVNGNYCVKCHSVADYTPPGSKRAQAPSLADVYRRLRPEFVRDWIANPPRILPYTAMPVNIPFENPPPVLQQLYHGTNVEQVEALTDLLMNFDQYARQSTRIADRVVQPPMPAGTPPAGAPAAPATGSATN